MPENAVVRARIDERIKEEASAVLAAMGLTVSDAFRMLLFRVARTRRCRSSLSAQRGNRRRDQGGAPRRAKEGRERR